ncbi:hypothetical protein [Halomicronema sp. CCY15110]|uniref:hypothetical protein n=1 Tax=Halomicronema sp. CCY15110 TaxID=2767773 RepID=UPI00194DC00E|nr:hypothetical protein [Halomicronema sp. CCY15110]
MSLAAGLRQSCAHGPDSTGSVALFNDSSGVSQPWRDRPSVIKPYVIFSSP